MLRLRLKEVLAQKNISQSRLSHMTYLSLNTIQEMIRDPYRDVRISTLDKIAVALNVSIIELYERVGEKEEKRAGEK
jgi:DNA-binding Xre family transcriptional regulator